MSTEVAAARAALRERAGLRRFRRSWTALVLSLAVAAAALGTASALQGPRVSSASLNAAAAVERAGQRLVIRADQPLTAVDAADVEVSPEAAVEVSTDGAQLTLRFTGLLRYATEYRVSVAVHGAATGIAGRLEHSFATPDIDVDTLVRHGEGTDAPDRVVRQPLAGSGAGTTLLEAPRIQEYARAGSLVAAVVLDAEGHPGIELASTDDGLTTTVSTPPARTIRRLGANASGDLLGFIVDGEGAGATSTLYLLDLTDGSWVPRAVDGPDGSPLAAMDWLMVPGTGSLVVQAQDEQLYLVDALHPETAPAPLGRHTELRGFLPGTLRLVVADPDRGAIVDLAQGTTTTLTLPVAEPERGLYPDAVTLTSDASYAALYVDPMGASDAGVRSVLYAVNAAGTRELFRPPNATSRIGAVCLSPNGQYLAVELVPGGSTADGYPIRIGWRDTTTFFVDAHTGAVRRSVAGMLADWCR